jgi:hypothetical protein
MIGMVTGGYGVIHVNALLHALNIPGISGKSLKSQERICFKGCAKLCQKRNGHLLLFYMFSVTFNT